MPIGHWHFYLLCSTYSQSQRTPVTETFSQAKSIVVAGERVNHGLLVIKYHLINQK
jgi:hypothetical protein